MQREREEIDTREREVARDRLALVRFCDHVITSGGAGNHVKLQGERAAILKKEHRLTRQTLCLTIYPDNQSGSEDVPGALVAPAVSQGNLKRNPS
jgi:hypothetical protein